VLYAYLMHCSTMDIPKLHFPHDEIIEIIPAAYQNEAKRIHIPGLDPAMVPGSPEDIRIPQSPPRLPLTPVPEMIGTSLSDVGGDGTGSGPSEEQFSMPGPEVLGSRPPEQIVNTSAEVIRDKVGDED
jgi:6-phosphofructo-2-kinase / fructose-2,6-biphosphatase 4